MNRNDHFQIPADEQVRQRMRVEMLENLDTAARDQVMESNNTNSRTD